VSRLPRITGREIVAALRKAGFEVAWTKGSHHFLRDAGVPGGPLGAYLSDEMPCDLKEPWSSCSRRCSRSCCSVTARTYSWKTICCGAGDRDDPMPDERVDVADYPGRHPELPLGHAGDRGGAVP